MLAEERKVFLLNKLLENPFINTTELSDLMGVSSMTIRRDLIKMEREGFCVRKHGGAIRIVQSVTKESPYEIKRHQHTEEKKRIAKAAIQLVENGDTLILDSGSTTYALALLLPSKEHLTVVTNDLYIAVKLAAYSNINLICTGGNARSGIFTLQGIGVANFIKNLRVDKTFLATDALHSDGTIANANIEGVPIKQAMISAAHQVILLVDSSKFRGRSFAKVCDILDVDYIITDSGLDEEHRRFCDDQDVKVIIA